MSNNKIFNYFLQLGAHIGSGIYEYNYSSALNSYLLGSRNNYYIFDLKKTVFFLKKALFYILKLGTFKQHLLFFYSDFTNYNWNTLKLVFSYLIKSKNHHSFINDKWVPGSITNFKSCFIKLLNILLNINSYKRIKKYKVVSNRVNLLSFKYHSFFFKYLFLKLLLLEKSNKHYIKLNNLNYKKYSLKVKKYWRVFSFLRSFSIVYTLADTFICFNPNNNLVPIYEMSKLNIPIVGIIDTNTAYATHVTFPIFSNDDSLLLNIFYINLFLNSFNIGLLNTKNVFDISLKYKSKIRNIRRLRLIGSSYYKSKRSLYNIRGVKFKKHGSDYENSSGNFLKTFKKFKRRTFPIKRKVRYIKKKFKTRNRN